MPGDNLITSLRWQWHGEREAASTASTWPAASTPAAPRRAREALPGGHQALEAQREAAGGGGDHHTFFPGTSPTKPGRGGFWLQFLLHPLVLVLGHGPAANHLPAVLLPQLRLDSLAGPRETLAPWPEGQPAGGRG